MIPWARRLQSVSIYLSRVPTFLFPLLSQTLIQETSGQHLAQWGEKWYIAAYNSPKTMIAAMEQAGVENAAQ